MNRNHTFLLFLVGSTFIFLGQGSSSLISFINKFKRETLPVCISYSHEEQVYFGAIFHTDSVLYEDQDTAYFVLEDVYEENTAYSKDSSLWLDTSLVRRYLLPKTKHVGSAGTSSYAETIDEYLQSDFYALSCVLNTPKYYGVIYERVFTTGIPSSEKYFCTIDKKGHFIASQLITSFVFSGTGTSASDARFPFFPIQQGCLDKDLVIEFTSYLEGIQKYKVKSNGLIELMR